MSPASKFVNAKKGGKLRAGCVHRLFREGRARLVDDTSRVSSAAPDPALADRSPRARLDPKPPALRPQVRSIAARGELLEASAEARGGDVEVRRLRPRESVRAEVM